MALSADTICTLLVETCDDKADNLVLMAETLVEIPATFADRAECTWLIAEICRDSCAESADTKVLRADRFSEIVATFALKAECTWLNADTCKLS